MSPLENDISRAVFETQNTGLVVLDRDKRVVAWNRWMVAASGISAQEAAGKHLEELFPGAATQRLSAAAADALAAGASRLLTHSLHPTLLPLRTVRGDDLIHDVSVQPLGDRPVTLCLIQITDVTAAVRRERILRQRQNARYDAVVQSAPDAILTLDAGGLIQSINPSALHEFGYEAHELIGQPMPNVLQQPEAWEDVWLAILSGEGVQSSVEMAGLRKDGSTSYLEVSASRWQSDRRVFVTAILRDVNKRRAAQEALRESETRLRLALDAGRMAIWESVSGAGIETVRTSPELNLLLGFPEDAHPTMDEVRTRYAPGARELLQEAAAAAISQGDRYMEAEFTMIRPDGSHHWLQLRANLEVTTTPEGTKLKATGVAFDITDRKRSEEHQRLLLNELNHRVKNTLTTVQSVVAQTLRNAPTAQEARDTVEQRLIALSRAHDILTRENWEAAELGEIVAQAVSPYRNRGEDRLHLRGPEVRLRPMMALALAMAFHELATNAVKYGALSNAEGEISITWRVDASGDRTRLQLRWDETGGPPVQAPTRRGFGTRLIERSLAQDLDGEVRIEFAPQGVICVVDTSI